jgi:hypothetical protein
MHTITTNTPNGLWVTYDKHVYEAETKEYFDTGSMELACVAGSCDIVDIN